MTEGSEQVSGHTRSGTEAQGDRDTVLGLGHRWGLEVGTTVQDQVLLTMKGATIYQALSVYQTLSYGLLYVLLTLNPKP